ncbi:LysR family transcriptional regulator [Pelagibius marinus]|uniref:LysR family transcriptional regulator n=1 Tax=Pelagibius marinus TaxID=2762760 RepID=UPI00187228DF|nr:LysR family transcriptional regulator [Pelagibius marinus]
MDRFRELTTFVAVAETGAFNAAARRLKMSPPAVTRLVTALEGRLGVQLFTRTTRQVALTEAGARLREDAVRILAELEEAETAALGTTTAPSGHLRLTAPVLFGQHILAPVLRDYLDAYPAVTAEALFIDRNVNLLDEGLDVALRIGELPDSSLSARRVGTLRRVVVASPGYLERHAAPETPEALRDHRLIFSTSVSEVPSWTFTKAGKRRALRVAPRLSVNGLQTVIDAALAGWGITRVLSYQVADALAEGRLVELLGNFEDEEIPIHLLHAEGRRAAAKTRSFIDFAAERLRGDADRLLARA